ncbi:hypothetical protein AKJ16_DCAP02493 [Drosera capensis]
MPSPPAEDAAVSATAPFSSSSATGDSVSCSTNHVLFSDAVAVEEADADRSDHHNCSHNSLHPSPPASLSYPWDANHDKVTRIVSASIKGFSIGAGLKGGLSLFSLLSRLTRRRRRRRSSVDSIRKLSAGRDGEDIVLLMMETLRYGLFLGTTARWRALVAGGIAGPSMLLTGLNTQHNSLAIYIFMRAAVLASRCGIKSERFGDVCKPLTWAHGDIFLMCLASSQILSAYILNQDSLPPSYKSFLNKHGGKDMTILQGLKDITSGMPFTNLEKIEEYYKSNGVDVTLDPQMKIPCSIVHGNQSCGGHFFSFLIEAYKRALPVYLPVYLIPALIVHRRGLLNKQSLDHSGEECCWHCKIKPVFINILFLCMKCNIPMVAIATFPTGLALAIEKKSRRLEISLYCLSRAIESFFTCMAEVGYLPQFLNIKRADVAVFSLSTAIIMHCYAQERDVFRSKYLNVLDWVFGVPPPPGYTPRYKHINTISTVRF